MKMYKLGMTAALMYIFLPGCADVASDEIDYTKYQNFDADKSKVHDAGECAYKYGVCKNKTDLDVDVYKAEFNGTKYSDPDDSLLGYYGIIDAVKDNKCFHHGKKANGDDVWGGDIDNVAIQSNSGVPLKITVLPEAGAKTSPVFTVYDESGKSLMYSGNSSVLKMISETNLMYVAVEDVKNIGSTGQCSPNALVGGDNYGYILMIERDDSYKSIDRVDVTSDDMVTKSVKLKAGEAYYLDVCMIGLASGLKFVVTADYGKRPFMSYLEGDTYNWGLTGVNLMDMADSVSSSGTVEEKVSSVYATDEGECQMYHFVLSDYYGDSGYPITILFSKYY